MPGQDYKFAEGIIQFAPGSQEATMTLTFMGDFVKENLKTFYIRFSNGVNVTIPGNKRSRVYILNDDLMFGYPVTKVFKFPSLAHRNQPLVIQGLPDTQNSLYIMDMTGNVVLQAKQYSNTWIPGNIASGMYFYQLLYRDDKGELQKMTGKLFITD